MTVPAWTWTYEGYDPAEETLRESICTLGNGVFATRGAASETPAGEVHYPGTYAAGVYNRLTSRVGQGPAAREVENEDMVNLPDWLPLRYRMRPAGAPPGDWLTPDGPELRRHRQTLDMRHGTLTRETVYEDGAGHRLTVRQLRFVHMGDPHLAVQRTEFTPEGWSGTLEVRSGIDGGVRNAGVPRYRDLAGHHLCDWRTGTAAEDTVTLGCRTNASGIHLALAARTRAGTHVPGTPVEGNGGNGGGWNGNRRTRAVASPVPAEAVRTVTGERGAFQELSLPVRAGVTVFVDKTVALSTGRERAAEQDREAARLAARAADFGVLLAAHRRAWEGLWQRTPLEVRGRAGRILRLHRFHLLGTLSPHTAALDAGVPARGLHGEAYRGHVFWDELFVLPYLNLHFPEVSRALLGYRYRRLPAACRAAREKGLDGAMFPWQSGSEGREETQEMHLNPRSGRWLPDHSRLQHHVGSAVAYNVWRYWQSTGDRDFLVTQGAEMLWGIARFWSSLARFDPGLGRYRIRGVVGPDEYHDGYPDAPLPGLDDNAYTNATAAWVLARARETYALLPDRERRLLCERLDVTEAERARWEEVSRLLHLPHHEGVISQFSGYERLAPLDWEGLRARYGDIRRLDRILEAEGDSPNRYQASKQADVLMLGYLFPPTELAALFTQLGYELDEARWHRTVDYYLARTSHGSTLSAVVHAWILARARRAEAWRYCEEALAGDVADLQGGTTGEGIHLGAMGGTLDLVQRGLPGLEVRDGALWLAPAPLPQLSKFAIGFRLAEYGEVKLRLRRNRVQVALSAASPRPLRVRVGRREMLVEPGTAPWVEVNGR
ncbi:glycoside hydrolase family 65 protein [Streptomyces sp. LD120]|uniref:Glycoside hydrolase family 65 protein n=1 Tax=Streptomyces physcomitrii TaxID=2724184 RepID=A0ABX1H0P4_9ACTN|nr:glycoside hydrolase family 65 protein [Streptomyces physcomitrii]NKI40935.1 glycoside hydrolase family 65 protein [Streptomyces physcomitrii]